MTVLTDLPRLDRDELIRYSRHIVLSEVGEEGQRRLKASKVLVVGAGGLGSPAAMYLAAAGIGTLGLVDFDAVDASNLQRQILHGTSDIGRAKLDSAAARLGDLNPHVDLVPHSERLTSQNAMTVLADYDVIVDGSDNFPTRYLINDACVLLGKPYVYGAILRFEGQASVFAAEGGPCYRCLFREPPPPELVPNCAEAGVLGVLPGVVGSIQALEAIKLVLNEGEPLIGRLLLFDALGLSFRELALQRDPECPVCGEHPTVTALIDYEEFCGVQQSQPTEGTEVTPQELAALREREEVMVLDVREPVEHQIAHIDGSVLIPLRELPERLDELDQSKRIVALCHTGVRSAMATHFLRQQGFPRVQNLTGGIDAWAVEIDDRMARY